MTLTDMPSDILMLLPLLPTILLGVGACAMLMVGAFTRSTAATVMAALGFLGGALALLVWAPVTGPVGLENGPALFNVSPFTNVASVLLVVGALVAIPVLHTGLVARGLYRPEAYVLLVLMLTGATLLPAANHMLGLYVALELMSFPLYILCAWARDDAKSSEAGLKYFVLGSLASGMLLFGISLLYAATGSLDFYTLSMLLSQPIQALAWFGIILVLVGVAFKLSLAPFHMWTPDVYEGAPTPVTALMSALPKLAAFALLVRLLAGPFGGAVGATVGQGLAVMAAASMLVGAPLAIVQTNLKRLLAYSTVANVGFIAVPVVALAGIVGPSSVHAAAGVLFYLAVYGVTSLGLFLAIIVGRLETTAQLKGLGQRQPWLAAALGALLFSLAGVPPLGGFMAKMLAFAPAVQAGWGGLVVLAVVASVIAAAYSLWLIKLMYFDAPDTAANASRVPVPGLAAMTLGVVVAGVVVVGVVPAPLHTVCLAAATAVF